MFTLFLKCFKSFWIDAFQFGIDALSFGKIYIAFDCNHTIHNHSEMNHTIDSLQDNVIINTCLNATNISMSNIITVRIFRTNLFLLVWWWWNELKWLTLAIYLVIWSCLIIQAQLIKLLSNMDQIIFDLHNDFNYYNGTQVNNLL